MEIVFRPSTLRESRSGSITGVVYFDFGSGRAFPAMEWSDFVVVLSNWWISAVTTLQAVGNEAKLQFMDGPYWIQARLASENHVEMFCVEDRADGGQVHFGDAVTLCDLKGKLLRLANDVVQTCDEHRFASPDLARLRLLLERNL